MENILEVNQIKKYYKIKSWIITKKLSTLKLLMTYSWIKKGQTLD